MNKALYMIFDLVSNTVIGQIIQELNDATATRSFHDALGNKDSILNQHPADYDLVCIGSLLPTGVIVDAGGAWTRIARGSDWLEMQKAKPFNPEIVK